MSDALSQLTTALAPKGLPKPLPFPTESYEHPSLPLQSKRLLNVYAEAQPADSRSPWALMPTPGLEDAEIEFGTGSVVALNNDYPSVLYAISANHAWRFSHPQNGVATTEDLGDLGAIATDDFPENLMPTIAVGPLAVVFCQPPRAYTCNHIEPTVHQIGGTFPGARSVAYLDGYFVFTADEPSAQFFNTGLLNPALFNALDFAFAEGEPDIKRRVMTLNGELWFMGDGSVEIWYDAGQADFAFRRRTGGVISRGTQSIKTCVIADGSMFWVTNGGIVLRSEGYKAKRISTHSVERIIRNAGVTNADLSLTYEQDGHTFYTVTYGDRTLVYDITTNKWAERSSSVDGSTPWRATSAATLGMVPVLGDRYSGKLFIPVPGLRYEGGLSVLRQFTMPPLWAGTSRAFLNRLEVEMEVGTIESNAQVLVQWSDDGGNTWSAGRNLSPGAIGAFRTRMYTWRLGSFHQRMFRFTTTSGAPTFYAVDASITGPPQTLGG
jgi:hypothetical protein